MLVRFFLPLAIIVICILIQLCVVTGCKRNGGTTTTTSEGDTARGLGGGGVQVIYNSPSGHCSCKGVELRSPGSGPRTLKLNCNHRDVRVNVGVGCEYRGNPHGCRAYNKNNGQQEFYQQALNNVGPRICTLLSGGTVFCPRADIITDICGNLGDKNLKYWSGP